MDFDDVDIELGGYWGASKLNLIYMIIDVCNEDKSKCATESQVKSLYPGADNNLFFSFYYPTHYFSPQNIESPLNYNYFYFYQTIDVNIIKKNVFFFQGISCDDDLGWIFNSVKTKTIFAFDYMMTDSFYKSSSDYISIKKTDNTVIYMNGLYFSKDSYNLKY